MKGFTRSRGGLGLRVLHAFATGDGSVMGAILMAAVVFAVVFLIVIVGIVLLFEGFKSLLRKWRRKRPRPPATTIGEEASLSADLTPMQRAMEEMAAENRARAAERKEQERRAR